MLSVLPAEQVFSPLDEELELLPGSLTPSLVESMIRLATWMPFGVAEKMLDYLLKLDVSAATIRRDTEAAGAAYVEEQTAQVEAIERELPPTPAGAAMQQVSVDGAMVSLVNSQWVEVKTLATGKVVEPVLEKGEWVVHTQELSYFSRLADHETFTHLATVEMFRRGIENAGLVCAVMDGAEWEQHFIDMHCPNAARILDFAHAAEHLAKVGQAVFGIGTMGAAQWLEEQLHELKHGDPQKVLGKLRGMRDELAEQGGKADIQEVVRTNLEYLQKRQEQICYAQFLKAGYPIGSGIVESANKLVVEDRLKGAGMHWARENVNPMLALRTIACSNRWEEAWPQISLRLRQKPQERAASRRAQRQPAQTVTLENELMTSVIAQTGPVAAPVMEKMPAKPTAQAQHGPRKPAADHPWRRMRIGKARLAPSLS